MEGPAGDLPIPIPQRSHSSSPPAYESSDNDENVPPPAPMAPTPSPAASSNGSSNRDTYFDLVHTETGRTEAVFIRHGSGGTSLVVGAGTSREPHEILEV